MSEYFQVTTDYLLKGIESEKVEVKKKPNTGIFTIVATTFNFMGVILSAVRWYEEQRGDAVAIGLIFIAIGCMIFSIGMAIGESSKLKAKINFWIINIWLISFIPLSCCFNMLTRGKGAAPYPLLVGSMQRYALFWIVYICICAIVDVTLIIYKARNKA